MKAFEGLTVGVIGFAMWAAHASPEKIQEHEQDLAISIRRARPDAIQGNIFTPGIAVDFRRIIREAWSAPGANRIRETGETVDSSVLTAAKTTALACSHTVPKSPLAVSLQGRPGR